MEKIERTLGIRQAMQLGLGSRWAAEVAKVIWLGVVLSIAAEFAIPTATLAYATGSSLVAVDCQRQKAWVALDDTGGPNGNGKVAEVDLTTNPDNTNPVVNIINLGNNDIPVGAAITSTGFLLVVAGGAGRGGHLYIFTLAGNNPVPGSPFAFPTGTDTGNISGVVYDPYRNQAVISVCDSAICDGFANPHTGWTFFNLTSAQFFPGQAVFGPVLAAAEPDSLSLNPLTQLVIAPADAIDPPSPENAIDAGDTTHSCTLSDKNLAEDQGDPDGSTADPTTNLFAVGDFFQPIVTVLNLNGALFSGNKAPCSLIEAGTNPNSVDVRVFAATGDPADVVALNQEFHQVLVASDLGPDVGLISLPTSPVFQLTGPLKFQASKLPDEPDGGSFAAFVLPFTATVEDCNKNQGLIVDDANRFLARVDLGILQNSPAKISTPLPAGKCTGGFNVSCSNGNGVRFFPLLAGGTDPVHKRRRRR